MSESKDANRTIDPTQRADHYVTYEEWMDGRANAESGNGLTLQQALREIGKVIANSANPGEVAAVLRALRGPDDKDEAAKQGVTVPIRYRAFGEMVGNQFGDCEDLSLDRSYINRKIDSPSGSGEYLPHWGWSVRRAVRALWPNTEAW